MAKEDANECPVPNGVLVIIGGKENKGDKPEQQMSPENYVPLEILKIFIGLVKRKEPVIEVVTSASSEGDASFAEYKKIFHDLGIPQVGHIHHNSRKEVLEDNLEERVNAAHGIFLS